LFIWDFKIESKDVRHALNMLDVPIRSDRDGVDTPWMLFGLSLSDIAPALLPIWPGGETRASFQLMALKRWWASGTAWKETWLGHGMDAHTLYLTILACDMTMFFEVFTVWTLFQSLYIILWDRNYKRFEYPAYLHRRPIRAALLWLICVVWLTRLLDAFQQAMQPRIPMLTVRLHQQLLLKNQLLETDYSIWDGSLEL
jgi:hypothetical protein